MLEPNDIAFRLLCKRAGCGVTYTGMISPLSKQKLYLDDKPILQLFGNSSVGIKGFMKKYDEEVSGWDFNLGCPSKLSKRLGHGGCLRDFSVIENILKIMRSSTGKALTIKIRKSDYAFEILEIAKRVGVDAVCIHARNVSQGYSGEVDYGFALEIKKKSGIPVIFSGDVNENNIEGILKDFDFVMVGRAAIGNPGIFSKFSGEKVNFGFGEYLDMAKRYGLFFRQIKYQAMNFTKGVSRGKVLRMKLVGAKSLRDIEEIMGLW
jgi:tRNA-dihydrouridine synthase